MTAWADANRVCLILDAAEEPTAAILARELRASGRTALADADGFCEEAVALWERIRCDEDTVARFADPEHLAARHRRYTVERVQHAAQVDLHHRIQEISA